MLLYDLRRLFGLAVVTACVGFGISLTLLARRRTIDFRFADQDDDIIVVDTRGPVVNHHPYNFTINNPDLCRCSNVSDEGPPLILVYVQTAPSNFQRRERVRQTWAKRDNYRGITLRTIFVLGHDRNSQLQAQLEMEAQRHGDIVQENFIDTYR